MSRSGATLVGLHDDAFVRSAAVRVPATRHPSASDGRPAPLTSGPLVVYESRCGRTHSLAEAVAAVLREASPERVPCVSLSAAVPHVVGRSSLLLVAAPTSMRRGVEDHRDERVAPDLVSGALRRWLAALPDGDGKPAAVFDTRPGEGIAAGAADLVVPRLRSLGYRVLLPVGSFVVDGAVGALSPAERARARAWAAQLLAGASLG